MKINIRKWAGALCLELVVAMVPGVCDAAFEWPTAAPAEVNIDPQMLAEMSLRIGRGDYGTVRSFLLVRHGKLVHEEYFNGYQQDDLMEVFSVTKSVASALVGVARRKGDLPGVDTPFSELFPSYSGLLSANPGAGDILFHDLLTQRHGFEWDEWSTSWSNLSNPAYQMMNSPDWWGYVLNRPVTAAADSVFRYSTGVSNLMGLAFLEHTGMSAADYALENLFPQLGITEADLRVTGPGAPLNPSLGIWPDGFTPTGHGLWLQARDLAKIGLLYLDDGVFQNRRLLDESWIEASTERYSNHLTDPEVFSEGIGYGYQWWVSDLPTPTGSVEVYRAWGYADQYIFVIPEWDIVVVTTAANWNDEGEDLRHAMRDVFAFGVGEDFDPLSDPGITGPWVADEAPSQGFMLEVVPSTGQVVLFWMTFEPGTGQQMWILGESRLQGRRTLFTFLRPEGGEFFGPQPAALSEWGEGEMIFTSCTTARLSYRSEVHGVEGAFDMRRLTPNWFCSDGEAGR